MKLRTAGLVRTVSIGGILAGLMLLPGCAGPSTKILPYEPGHMIQGNQEAAALRPESANPFYLGESLEYLTRTPRISGSEEEEQAVRYMQQLLTDYGYEIQLLRFVLADRESPEVLPKYGTNLIAVKKADAPDADILIISTRHDTAADSPGAGSAAAAAVWLECARLLAGLPTDTQIRFVSFSGSENHYAGSQAYVETLLPDEKHRIIGVIHLDQLGDINQEELLLGSIDGEPVMVGDMLAETAETARQGRLSYQKKTDSDIISFIRGQIPAVSLSQRWESYVYRLPQDRLEAVDVDKLVSVTATVTATAARIMSSETPSLTAKSHFINDLQNRIYVQEPGWVLPFGEGPERLCDMTGLAVNLVASKTDGAGVRVDTYRYPMKWFRTDQVILTDFYYRDGKLDTISPDADGAGVTFGEMQERLQACYGEPAGKNQGPYGTEYDWVDPVCRTFIALIPAGDGFDVDIREFQTAAMPLAKYHPDGTLLEAGAGDERRYDGLFALTAAVFGPGLGEHVAYLDIYTDGIGATRGYIKRQEDDGGSSVVIGIDGADALLADGSFRDYPKTAALLMEYYGRVLEQTTEAGCAAAFYEAFSDKTEPAGFAESFRLFIVCQEPDTLIHESDAEIGFFYDYKSLTKIRSRIREQLKLADSR